MPFGIYEKASPEKGMGMRNLLNMIADTYPILASP